MVNLRMQSFFRQFGLSITWVVVLIVIQFVAAWNLLVAPVSAMISTAERAYQISLNLKENYATKNVGQMVDDLQEIHEQWDKVDGTLLKVPYLARLPIIKGYYQDLRHVVTVGGLALKSGSSFLTDFQPFASVIGFSQVDADADTSESKLQQLVAVTPQLLPTFDRMLDDLAEMLPLLDTIDPARYPVVSGHDLGEYVQQVRSYIGLAEIYLPKAKEALQVFPLVMGSPTPQNYLVILQNDKELRPTGGFITAYADLEVSGGKISISDTRDIYKVSAGDGFLTPPEPIVLYLKQNGWWMRDTNFSPDFKSSMDTFTYYWNRLQLPPYDGIIAVDTQLVASLLAYTGPIHVADYNYDFSSYWNLPKECLLGGEFFTEENTVCRLEVYAERLGLGADERKSVIGALMGEIFNKLMTAPSSEWYAIINVFMEDMQAKHLLVYLKDEEAQQVVESFNWGGRIVETNQLAQDYLHVNDANLAGLKSDMYLKRSVEQRYEVDASGVVTKTLTLTYANTGGFDGWLNATSRNYVRVYVPLGAELIDSSGGTARTLVTEDLGKTVFDNFMLIKPLSEEQITFKYKLPNRASDLTELVIQKQPGVESIPYKVIVNSKETSIDLNSDRLVDLNLK